MKRYKILEPISLGFLTPQDQYDMRVDPSQRQFSLEFDEQHTIWLRQESITTSNAIGIWLEQGKIEEIPPTA